MKRPKLKKASKRMTCAKRFKIQKKVREHNRKLRKEAKKSGIRRRVKKDIGVPNSAPFKEEVLREAEQRKQELEELKQKNKLVKQKERAEKRKKGKEEDTEDVRVKKKKIKKEEKVRAQREARAAVAKKKSSKKFRCSELNKVIEASDVILEILDARDPMGCRCAQLEEAVLKHEGKKRLMFVLNKIDLVPKDNLVKWVQYLKAQCPTFVFKSSVHIQDRTVRQKKQRAVNDARICRTRAVVSFGHDSLMQTLNQLANNIDSETMLKVGVVGFPNVGKSSIINTLKGVRVCNAGVPRGLTKCMQEVHISEKVKMIDSPSIVAAPSNSTEKVALRSLQSDDKEENAFEAVKALLKQFNQQHKNKCIVKQTKATYLQAIQKYTVDKIMLQYNVPNYRHSLEFLTFVAKKRGWLQKGAQPDTEQAAAAFLSDLTGAKLIFYSKVPERADLPLHFTNAMVTEMQTGVNLDQIKLANKRIIKCIRQPKSTSTLVRNSIGLTAGILNVDEIPEEPHTLGEEEEEEDVKEEADEETEEMEDNEEIEITDKKKTQTLKSVIGKQKKGTSNPAHVNIDLLAAQKDGDNAYDFSTDFV